MTENNIDAESLPIEWQIGTFEKDVTIKGRIGWRGYKTSDLRESGPVVIGGANLKSSYYINNEINHISNEKYDESPDIKLKTGDVLLVTRGNGLADAGFFDGNIEEATINPSVIILSDFKGDPRFLFYYLISHEGRQNVLSLSSGSSIPAIYQADVRKLKYPKPPVGEQKRIADFLVDFDRIIELNRQTNSALEQIGQMLFNHWFVDFEFPNQEGKPYKSSGGEMVNSTIGEIPKGWEIGGLSDICDITMGQSPPGDTYNETGEGIPFFQGIRDFGFRFPSRRIYCTAPTRLAQAEDVLLSVRAPVGSLNVAEERCVIGRGVAALHLKGKQKGFLYYLLLATRSGWDMYESEGTVFGSATKQDVHDFKIVIPSKNLRDQFGELIEPLDKRILINELECRNLTMIRDSLLPRLMSGKIRVPIDDKMERQ